jgi:pimeloyl-ACP methyl ester carboxylesterase
MWNSYTDKIMPGFSYGTTLGATVAAMFPDKIDKMILDGVQNPHEYYHSLGYVLFYPNQSQRVDTN